MDTDVQDSALLKAILEAAEDAIIVADENGTILRINPATCRLFQYDTNELVGQGINTIIPAADS